MSRIPITRCTRPRSIRPGGRLLAATLAWLLLLVPAFSDEAGKPHPDDPAATEGAVEDQAGTPGQSSAPQPTPYVPPTGEERFRDYLRQSFGPLALLRSAASAGVHQARDHNPEWGQGMEGYGRRLASKHGNHLVRVSLESGLAALLREDNRFFPSGQHGFWPRTGEALRQVYLTRTSSGERRFATSNWAAAFGAGLISRTWHPEREQTVSAGLRTGALTIAIDASMNVLREFWPDIRKKLGR